MDTSSSTKNELALFTVLIGCTPAGRNIEQHDVFFGVAEKLEDLTENMKEFWHKNALDELAATIKKLVPGLDKATLKKEMLTSLSKRTKVHIDAWTKVDYADGYRLSIQAPSSNIIAGAPKLYFINLGGYRENEFEEYHKKFFVVAETVTQVMAKIKRDDFMKTHSPISLGKPGSAHLDDQHNIDFEADDIVCISDVLNDRYTLVLEKLESPLTNKMVVGYLPIDYKS